MANSNVSQRAGFDTERSLAATSFTGVMQAIGTALTVNPVMIIFDNQTDVAVPISIDGTNIWKTFSAGEALVLDMRSNHGIAENFLIDLGTLFQTNAAVGLSGSFRISIIYAR